MFKTVVLASLLAASCAANAATTWTFSYKGFFDEDAQEFVATRVMEGSFSGSDKNADGLIERGEITSFVLNSTDYVGCSAGSNDYYQCGLDIFSYQDGGKLDFFAGTSGTDPEGYSMAGHYFHAGNREADYRTVFGFYHESSAFVWTEQTEFTIAHTITQDAGIPAVPEPGTWTMLAAGLLLVSGASRRLRRN